MLPEDKSQELHEISEDEEPSKYLVKEGILKKKSVGDSKK